MTCRVVCGQQLSNTFQVRTGVRQGCLLLPFLFLLAIDWVTKTSTAQKRNGIQRTPWTQLDYLDFADDLALLSHSQQQMQDKTTIISVNSKCLGHPFRKEQESKIKTESITPRTIEGDALEEVESFTYLGVVDKLAGTDADVKVRIGKARAASECLGIPRSAVKRQAQDL